MLAHGFLAAESSPATPNVVSSMVPSPVLLILPTAVPCPSFKRLLLSLSPFLNFIYDGGGESYSKMCAKKYALAHSFTHPTFAAKFMGSPGGMLALNLGVWIQLVVQPAQCCSFQFPCKHFHSSLPKCSLSSLHPRLHC